MPVEPRELCPTNDRKYYRWNARLKKYLAEDDPEWDDDLEREATPEDYEGIGAAPRT
jgi:hypothetical protein